MFYWGEHVVVRPFCTVGFAVMSREFCVLAFRFAVFQKSLVVIVGFADDVRMSEVLVFMFFLGGFVLRHKKTGFVRIRSEIMVLCYYASFAMCFIAPDLRFAAFFQ